MAVDLGKLLEDFGWGDLKDHYSNCAECSGTGLEDDEEDSEKCSYCDDGKLRWGSFYTADEGLCDLCGTLQKVAGGLYEDRWVCLVCYLKDHKRACGCNLFEAAERAAELPAVLEDDA